MRRWWIALVACLALAVAGPALWWLTRPSADAGVPVASVGSTSAATSPATSSATSAATPAATGPGPLGIDPAAVPVTPAVPDGAPVVADTQPVSLSIPTIGVQAAPVDAVGVRSDGAMLIPDPVDRVGWYRYGSVPGSDEGAAVIAGHVDSKTQGRGALFRLRELTVGDRVDVRLSDGRVVRYAVAGKQTLVKKRLPTEKLFARDGAPRLVLITCGGPFIPQLSSYQDNVVVVAEPVGGASP